MHYQVKITLFLLFIAAKALAQDQPELHYELSMPEPHNHYYEVTMRVNNVNQNYLDFKMPVWTPGSYLIREFSRNVLDVQAEENNKSLVVKKINKNTWRVSGITNSVNLTYKVYAYELSVRTSFLDASHGFVLGTSVFMFVEGYQDLPVTLQVIPYKNWNQISTGLQETDDKWNYRAENYDFLVDSPLEIGNHEQIRFEAAGVNHEIAMYGEGNYDSEKLRKDMARIVEVSTRVFGENPNQKYVFIVHNLHRRGGGLEHLNSTTLQVKRWNYQPFSSYLGYLGLVAHEYFHLWLVKRIRPKALGPFNYDEENYTHLLWVMEGFTSYYDELLLNRADFISDSEYLSRLSRSISSLENQPGNFVQPVAMASFDAWIKAYRPDEQSPNVTISYYTKGAVLAALLDLEIIHQSNGKRNLDDVLRFLYQEYYQKLDRGFTNQEFQEAVEKIAGKKLEDFFQNYVFGAKSIDYSKFLEYAGLELMNVNEDSQEPALGVKTRNNGGGLIVQNVTDGSAAHKGGINVDDEIIAVNGYRVDQSLLSKIISEKTPQEEIEVLINRRGVIQTLDITLQPDNNKRFVILKSRNPSQKQEAVLKKWLE